MFLCKIDKKLKRTDVDTLRKGWDIALTPLVGIRWDACLAKSSNCSSWDCC